MQNTKEISYKQEPLTFVDCLLNSSLTLLDKGSDNTCAAYHMGLPGDSASEDSELLYLRLWSGFLSSVYTSAMKTPYVSGVAINKKMNILSLLNLASYHVFLPKLGKPAMG